mmetsp:Transcript_3577/g.8551  ORF Transcript_3577/g.8551 Transcript_3577/m.8551 type:complete len:275 (+) Transcript_3577:302-1126(+)
MRVEAPLRAPLDELHPAGGRQPEDPAALGAVRRRHHDGYGLVEEGLVANLRVDVDRGEEAGLRRVRVNPPEGKEPTLVLHCEDVFLVQRGDGVAGSLLVRDDQGGDGEDARLGVEIPREDAAGLDALACVGRGEPHELLHELHADVDVLQPDLLRGLLAAGDDGSGAVLERSAVAAGAQRLRPGRRGRWRHVHDLDHLRAELRVPRGRSHEPVCLLRRRLQLHADELPQRRVLRGGRLADSVLLDADRARLHEVYVVQRGSLHRLRWLLLMLPR